MDLYPLRLRYVFFLRLRLRLINQFLEEKNTQEQPKPGA